MLTCLLTNFGFTIFLALGWAFSECLGNNDKIKANSVYQFVRIVLKTLMEGKS
jgi:hypothetical protein